MATRKAKPVLNLDLLEKLEAELVLWDLQNVDNRWFSMWRWARFAVMSGSAPQVVEEPYLDLWKGMALKETRRKLELYPRGAAKSFMLKGFCAFLLCEPDSHLWGKLVRIAFCGQTRPFATRSVGALRRMLETNLFILREYPTLKPDKNLLNKRRGLLDSLGYPEDAEISKPTWQVAKFRTALNIEGEIEHGVAMEEPSCWAQGMDEASTGFHMDVIIMDDPVGKATFKSPAKKETARDTYNDLQMQLMDGLLVILGTRWCTDDIHQTILDEYFESFEVQIWNIAGNSGAEWTREDFIRGEDGVFTFRGDWSKEKIFSESYGIIQKEVEQGFRFSPERRRYETLQFIGDKIHNVPPSFWQKQMMNRAHSEEDQIFHEWMFRTIPNASVPAGLPTYVLTDSATGTDSRSSYRVAATVAVDAGPVFYFLKVEFGRWTPEPYMTRVLNMESRFGTRKTLMEQVAWQDCFKVVAKLLCREQGRRNPRIVPVYGRSLITKHERMEKMEPFFAANKVYFTENILTEECDGKEVWREVKAQFINVRDANESKGLLLDIPDALSDCLAQDRDGKVICRPKKYRGQKREPSREQSMQGIFRKEREKTRKEARHGGLFSKRNASVRAPKGWK